MINGLTGQHVFSGRNGVCRAKTWPVSDNDLVTNELEINSLHIEKFAYFAPEGNFAGLPLEIF